jgi:pimeloyl-[acyl-carrier protein] methyl ester esterase
MKRCFVFCHGFGFDVDFWKTIRAYFAQEECVYLDLGYFGHENFYIPRNVELIGIGHSWGFLRLILMGISFTKLIGLQGFSSFLGFNQQLHARRQRELDIFIRMMNEDPLMALRIFHRRCGVCIENGKLLQLDKTRLLKDLEQLSSTVGLLDGLPICIIGANDDPIVPPDLINDNFAHQKNVEITILERGFHALGLVDCQTVYRKTMEFVRGQKQAKDSATI